MIKFTDNSDKFLNKLKLNNKDTLDALGRFGKKKMDEFVAIDTGYLQSRNDYKVFDNTVELFNDCKYAIHQEYGTYKMKAHPFMRPAAFNFQNEMLRMIASNMSKGI